MSKFHSSTAEYKLCLCAAQHVSVHVPFNETTINTPPADQPPADFVLYQTPPCAESAVNLQSAVPLLVFTHHTIHVCTQLVDSSMQTTTAVCHSSSCRGVPVLPVKLQGQPTSPETLGGPLTSHQSSPSNGFATLWLYTLHTDNRHLANPTKPVTPCHPAKASLSHDATQQPVVCTNQPFPTPPK